MPEDIYNTGSDTASSSAEAPQVKEESLPKTQEVFEEYLEGLDLRIKDASNKFNVKSEEFDGALTSRRYTTRKVIQGQKALKEYTLFSNFVSNTVGQDVIEINKKILTANEVSAQIKTKLSAAVDAIKDAKDKMGLVDAKACKLSDALKESCNADQLRILCKVKDFEKLAQGIITKADQAHDAADDAYEVAIKVSAIHAFSNVESLKELGTSLEEKGKAFQADVEENIIFNKEKLDSAYTELTTSLTELSTAECAKYQAALLCDALSKLKDKTYEKDMETIGSDLMKICENVENAFDYLEEENLIEESKSESENDWSSTDG